jgi:hypothetical protein
MRIISNLETFCIKGLANAKMIYPETIWVEDERYIENPETTKKVYYIIYRDNLGNAYLSYDGVTHLVDEEIIENLKQVSKETVQE